MIREVYVEKIVFSTKLLVDLVPALRYASKICLNYATGSSPTLRDYKEVVSFFDIPTRMEFWEIPIEALAAFLEGVCVANLKGWSAFAPGLFTNPEKIDFDGELEDIICRSCFAFANLGQDEPKETWFVGWNLRWNFLRRLIEVLAP